MVRGVATGDDDTRELTVRYFCNVPVWHYRQAILAFVALFACTDYHHLGTFLLEAIVRVPQLQVLIQIASHKGDSLAL